MQVPPQLQYNQLQTKAFFSVYKEWPIEPVSNGGQYWPGEVIRIFLNSLTDGVMDPYRSHIQITVSCHEDTLPVGLLQVDNSAQSFIQQLVIQSKNREIQRIIEYGIIAAYLTDIGLSQFFAQGRQAQGLGYSNIDNYSNIYSNTLSAGSTSFDYDRSKGIARPYYSPGTVFPTIPAKTSYATFQLNAHGFPLSSLAGINRCHVTPLNTAWQSQQQAGWWWQYINSNQSDPPFLDSNRVASILYYGYSQNMRAQYLANYALNDYVDSTTSLSSYEIRLQPSVQNGQFPSIFTNQTKYNTYISNYIPVQFGSIGQKTLFPMQNTTALGGFSNLNSPNFAKGVRQPFISPTVPQCQMVNGKILKSKIPIKRRKFKIPLVSAVLGLLIPQSQFVLLPLRSLNDVLMELTIDPHAMFTSGYNDISQFDSVGMALMQQRAFKIERIVYNLHTYQFYTPELDQYVRVSLTSGIAINSHVWQLGNQYQIQNSQSITNSWPVACNQQALNEILILFYPLDYQQYSFCRKHFRISNNITKLQLRMNMDYYPSQPLSGNGGNPVMVDQSGDNSIFLEQIYLSNGYMFSSLSPLPRINSYNFAINQRCYNIMRSQTFYDPSMIDNKLYQWKSQSINVDTALGMPNVHQNRYVGKAAYLFSFQPYSHSKNFLTGIDCRGTKQFDVILTANPDSWFPRPQAMYIFTRSSVIFQYGKDGIINVSK